MHICMTYLDKGDAALIPNPGYPTYSSAVKLSGGETLSYELKENEQWHPNVVDLKNLVQAYRMKNGKVKLLFLNYPHMPTGQLPERHLLEEIIAFAKAEKI